MTTDDNNKKTANDIADKPTDKPTAENAEKNYIIDSVLIKGGEKGNIAHKEIVVMVSRKINEHTNEWVSLKTVKGDAGTVEGDAGILRKTPQGTINIFGKKENIKHALVAECIKCYKDKTNSFKPKITSTGKGGSIRILFRNDFYRAVCNRNRLQKKDVSIEVRNFGTTSLNYKTKKRRTGLTGTSENLMHITKINKSGESTNALEITEITSKMMQESFSSGLEAKMKHEHPKDFLIAAICYMNNIEDYNLPFIGDNTISATDVSKKSTQKKGGGKTRRFKK